MGIFTRMQETNDHKDPPGKEPMRKERQPWPLKYVALAIALFIVLFNLYQYWSSGN